MSSRMGEITSRFCARQGQTQDCRRIFAYFNFQQLWAKTLDFHHFIYWCSSIILFAKQFSEINIWAENLHAIEFVIAFWAVESYLHVFLFQIQPFSLPFSSWCNLAIIAVSPTFNRNNTKTTPISLPNKQNII